MGLLLTFLISLILTPPHQTTSKPEGTLKQDTEALLAFFNNIKIPKKYQPNKEESACTWKGVQCINENAIAYIRLPAKSMIGEIPPNTIGNITTLRVLSLRQNRLGGTIPPDFSNLRHLKTFVIYNNSFTGYLPYINAPKLKHFNVSINSFIGSVPTRWAKFPASAFSGNTKLCGKPLSACDGIKTFPSPPPPQPPPPPPENNNLPIEAIVGIAVGSPLVLLLLLSCLQKKRTYPREHDVQKLETKDGLTAGTSTDQGEGNKLVFFDDNGIHGFDLEDILRSSGKVLGRGSVGTAYKMTVKDGTTVVVKRLENVVVTKDEFDSQMEVLGKMKNENVVTLRAYHYSENNTLLVYDYMHGGSLSTLLHGRRGSGRKRLQWDHRLRIALSAAKGLVYLHTAGIVVHGNIKSSNIFLREETNKDASVSDYGLNTLFSKSSSQNTGATGYQAPEVLETQQTTFKSDVYSFGVLLLELLTGKSPNQASLPQLVRSAVPAEWTTEILDVQLRGNYGNNEEFVKLFRIAMSCVSLTPDQRPTMQDVVTTMEGIHRQETILGSYPTPSIESQSSPRNIISP